MGTTYYNQNGMELDCNIATNDWFRKLMPFWSPFLGTSLSQLKTPVDIQMLIRVLENYIHCASVGSPDDFKRLGFEKPDATEIKWIQTELISFLGNSSVIYWDDEWSELQFYQTMHNKAYEKMEQRIDTVLGTGEWEDWQRDLVEQLLIDTDCPLDKKAQPPGEDEK
jgi:hypothetical protein